MLRVPAQVTFSIFFAIFVAHPLNHTARRSLGRMYGFLFDTFSQIPTVQSLGLLSRQTVRAGSPPPA